MSLCTGRPGMAAAHCYHDTGITYTSNPPLREQVCCHCAEKRNLTVEVGGGTSAIGHGPHFKTTAWFGSGSHVTTQLESKK